MVPITGRRVGRSNRCPNDDHQDRRLLLDNGYSMSAMFWSKCLVWQRPGRYRLGHHPHQPGDHEITDCCDQNHHCPRARARADAAEGQRLAL